MKFGLWVNFEKQNLAERQNILVDFILDPYEGRNIL